MTATAASIMTRNVISVGPNALVPQIAAILMKNAISAVPVIDSQGRLLGMVSEGDLMKPLTTEVQEKRDWWLEMLSEGEHLAPEFLDYISQNKRTASEIMTDNIITAPITATREELAGLLDKHHIKRVPIMEGQRVVGIVSRANIIRSLADGAG